MMPSTAHAMPAPVFLRDEGWYARLRRLQPKLTTLGTVMGLMALLLLLAVLIDPRSIDGHSFWVKPIKFFLSLTAYFWTLAWFLGYLSASTLRTLAARYVLHVTPVLAILEMAWLIGMALAGQPSHFNRSTPWAAALYSAAGIGAVGLTLGILLAGVLVAREKTAAIPATLRLAMVLGAVLTFIGTLVFAGALGGGSGHSVGGVAGHPGLPLLGWSTTGGDLRVAHFWATHAVQALPLVGVLLARRSDGGQRWVVWLAAVAYAAFTVMTYYQARAGVPFIGL